MAKLSSLSASKTHRVMIFGAPKSGKSLLAGKLAEHFKIIWIDLENGHEVLFQLPPEWQENIELISLPDTRSYPIAIETCLKLVKGKCEVCEAHGKVSCMTCKKLEAPTVTVDLNNLDQDTIVVFDSATQLTNSAIANITKNEPDDYKLNYDDWGNLGKLLDIFFSHIQQGKYNCIVISHEVESETEGGKTVLVPVAGTKNTSRNVAKYFDHVIYAERKNKKHVFSSSTTASTTILTGSRSNVALEQLKAEDLLPIFKPELFVAPSSDTSKDTDVKVPVSTEAAKTSSLLDRLKKNAAAKV